MSICHHNQVEVNCHICSRFYSKPAVPIQKKSEEKEKWSETYNPLPLLIKTNKKWWQIWKPSEFLVDISVTVNRNLEVAVSQKRSDY
jgi:hypothetical protein